MSLGGRGAAAVRPDAARVRRGVYVVLSLCKLSGIKSVDTLPLDIRTTNPRSPPAVCRSTSARPETRRNLMSYNGQPTRPRSNRILSAAPREEYERLSPRLEYVELYRGQVLHEAGEPMSHVYFPYS